jgi:hypothetical protein
LAVEEMLADEAAYEFAMTFLEQVQNVVSHRFAAGPWAISSRTRCQASRNRSSRNLKDARAHGRGA